MINESFLHLQSGSDVRGVAMREEVSSSPVTLTGEIANRIAASFAEWISQRLGKASHALRIGVGHDSRLTSQLLKAGIIQGLTAQGVKVFDCGLSSTPAMFMGTVFEETGFDGSIMITASHMPRDRNGMKFFTREGGLDKPDVKALLERAPDMPLKTECGTAETIDLIGLYCAFLCQKIIDGVGGGQQPLSGLRIAVDAGNGAGGFYVRGVLEPLGADCAGSRYLEPDGNFPHHRPDPENREAMASIRAAVCESGADLGIIFDTDVDRMSAVLPGGAEVNRNAIIAMMASILAPENPGSTIVTDSITSDRLTAFLVEKLGLRHHRFKRGYKNVINEAIRLNKEGIPTPLAIETSGHGALKENYFLDDGAYMAARLVIATAKAKREGKALASLLDGFEPAGFERELRLPLTGTNFAAAGQEILDELALRAKAAGLCLESSYEGVRISFPGKGWAMLRMSLHEPLMPLNLESGTQQGLVDILQTVRSLLAEFDRLDISAMQGDL